MPHSCKNSNLNNNPSMFGFIIYSQVEYTIELRRLSLAHYGYVFLINNNMTINTNDSDIIVKYPNESI